MISRVKIKFLDKDYRFYLILFLLLFASTAIKAQDKLKVDSLKLLTRSKDKTVKISALLTLADEYEYSDNELAKAYIYQAKAISEEIGVDSILAKTYNNLAIMLSDRSSLDSALYYHQKSLEIRTKIKDKKGMADSYNNMGICYDQSGNFTRALEQYFNALKIYESGNEEIKMAMVYTNIGVVYKAQKEFRKAHQYYLKAYEIYKDHNRAFGLAIVAGNIGSVLLNLGEYEDAYQFASESKAGYENLGYERYVGYTLTTLGKAQENMGNYKPAEEIYRSSLTIHRKFSNYHEIANTSNYYGGLLNKQKQFSKAIDILNDAENAVKESGSKSLQTTYYSILSESYAGLGDYQNAYLFSKMYAENRDSLFEEEKTKAVFELETRYETEKKEKEILEQKSTIIQKQQEIKRKNIQFYGSVGLLVTALAMAYLIYIYYKQKNIREKREAEIKEAKLLIENQKRLHDQRLKISRDLHDNIGSQLTFIISSLENLKFGFNIENQSLKNRLSYIGNFARETITELRDTIWAMNRDEISIEDINIKIRNFVDKAKLACPDIEFNLSIQDNNLPEIKFSSLKGINLYRVIQESLNNALKHAHATQIDIKTYIDGNSDFRVEINDNGKGFDVEELSSGNGLMNMERRIGEAGGELKMRSQINKGTSVEIKYS